MFPNVANLAPFLPSYLSAELPSTQYVDTEKESGTGNKASKHTRCVFQDNT